MVSDFIAGLLTGAFLVLANALLVARSLMRSEHIEYVAGMAAMANTFLIASMMAVQAGFGRFQPAFFMAQVILLGLVSLRRTRQIDVG
jgi:threonine/homoserine efflux transporter RhtA